MSSGLRINQSIMERILGHVRQSYPHECCGVLIGASYANKEVEDCRAIPNLNQDRSHDRYLMDPKELNRVDTELRKKKLEILGFYHSHPDHPSRPSEFDRQHAWPIYSYVVIACEKGSKTQTQSWVLNEATQQFEEEQLIVT